MLQDKQVRGGLAGQTLQVGTKGGASQAAPALCQGTNDPRKKTVKAEATSPGLGPKGSPGKNMCHFLSGIGEVREREETAQKLPPTSA